MTIEQPTTNNNGHRAIYTHFYYFPIPRKYLGLFEGCSLIWKPLISYYQQWWPLSRLAVKDERAPLNGDKGKFWLGSNITEHDPITTIRDRVNPLMVPDIFDYA